MKVRWGDIDGVIVIGRVSCKFTLSFSLKHFRLALIIKYYRIVSEMGLILIMSS